MSARLGAGGGAVRRRGGLAVWRSGGGRRLGRVPDSPSQALCSAILLSLLGCLAIGLRGLNNIWEFCFGQGGAGAQFSPHCAPSVVTLLETSTSRCEGGYRKAMSLHESNEDEEFSHGE